LRVAAESVFVGGGFYRFIGEVEVEKFFFLTLS
jgi:hypothetical protein